MKNTRKLISLLLIAALLLSVPANAISSIPCASYNACEQNYKLNSKPVNSYLFIGLDGQLTRADYSDDVGRDIFIEPFADDYTAIMQRSIIRELDRFCGLYTGSNAYYAVYAGSNLNHRAKTKVFTVVKYDADWQELASVSVNNVDVEEGCYDGNLRMVEHDGILYVHTCRVSYSTEEEEGEQGSFMFAVNTETMSVVATSASLSDAQHGYVTASLDQYIAFDGDRMLTVDVADKSPRGVILSKYVKNTLYPYYIGDSCTSLNVLPFSGEQYDFIGASVGGFEVTSSHYMIAGNTTSQSAVNVRDEVRNIFISVTDKNNFTEGGTTLKYITNYGKDSGIAVSTPHLVKLDNSSYMLLWNENDTVLKYVTVSAAGDVTGEIKSCAFTLSDCKPVVYKRKVMWYSTADSMPVFYEISLGSPGIKKITHFDNVKWLCVSKPFTDVKLNWAHAGIDFCVANGFMNGTTATSFEPNAPMNRAMLVTVLWRLDGSPASTDATPFTDLKQNWYKQAVAWAYKNGIVNGMTATKFDPTGSITREQIASIFYRYSAYKKYAVSNRADLSVFPDAGEVHEYAKTALSWANGCGLILGIATDDEEVSLLSPRGNATRAQVATILMRYCARL